VSSGIYPAKLLLELPGFVDEVEIGVAPVVLIFRPSIPPWPQPHPHGSRRCNFDELTPQFDHEVWSW
jgi:hypothetical protein